MSDYSVVSGNIYKTPSLYSYNSNKDKMQWGYNPAFTSQADTFTKSADNSQVQEKSGLSKGIKIGLGALALAGIGGVAYVLTRGRAGSSVEKPVQQVKEMALDAFKQAGNKFNQGKAITAAGEGYTGTLTHTGSDGSRLSMEYVDGLLKKSTKTKNDVQLFEKSYSYGADNGLIKVETKKNGELVADFKKEIIAEKGVIFRTRRTLDKGYNSVQDIATGKMIEANGKRFYYTKDGLLRASRDKNRFLTVYHANGKPRLVQDEYGIKLYGENGDLACTINTDLFRGARDYFAKYPDRSVKYELSYTMGLSKDMAFYAPGSSRPNVKLSKFMKDGKWYPSATVYHGDSRYNIDIADEIWDITYGSDNAIKNVAKYNPKTGDIDVLESSVTKDNIQNVIDQIKKAASSVKQEHKAARQIIREYQEASSLISKSNTAGLRDSSFIF